MDTESTRKVEFVPRHRRPPMAIARAEGNYLYTPEGQKILDAAGGAIVAGIGHGRKEVAEVAARALQEVSYVVPPFVTEHRLRLIERLTDRWLPSGFTRCWFGTGGSDCVDAAVRLARQHHVAAGRASRTKIIARNYSYHGTTVYNLSLGGHPRWREGFGAMLQDLPKAAECFCARCPFGKTFPSCDTACADDLERVIAREGPDTIAAFVAEPMSGTTLGAVAPPSGDYWQKIRRICDRHGILLVMDEVMTGFGRTGKRFCLEHWDARPDILVGGKGLAAGYAPLGGVFTSDAVIEPIAKQDGELMFLTYGGHSAACAVADKVLEIMEREELVARAATMGRYLKARLEDRLRDHPNVLEVRGLGLLLAVELVSDRATRRPFPHDALIVHRTVAAGFRRGVSIYPAGAGDALNAVAFGPPFTITEAECDLIADVVPAAITDAVSRAA